MASELTDDCTKLRISAGEYHRGDVVSFVEGNFKDLLRCWLDKGRSHHWGSCRKFPVYGHPRWLRTRIPFLRYMGETEIFNVKHGIYLEKEK